jgi:hypothetical protein
MALAPTSILDAWERAAAAAAGERPLALLGLMLPDARADTLAQLPLGLRDSHLLRLRQQLFGDRLFCLSDCPACQSELEFSIRASDLLQQGDHDAIGEHWAKLSDYRVRFRSPNTADLLAVLGYDAEAYELGSQILARCVTEVQGLNGPVELEAFPRELLDPLTEEMERRDPLAVVWLDLRCEQCGHGWRSMLDIASILWAEVDGWADTMLQEVHHLARAYGWSERDILQMSPARRRRYLDMAGS